MTYTQEYRPRFKKEENKQSDKPTTIFGEAKLLIIIFACVFL